jgi:hypothetical protein
MPLPKFLIADDLDTTRAWVVHTAEPRFIAEAVPHGTDTFLDPVWQDPVAEVDTEAIRDLMRAASAFYRRSLESHGQRN